MKSFGTGNLNSSLLFNYFILGKEDLVRGMDHFLRLLVWISITLDQMFTDCVGVIRAFRAHVNLPSNLLHGFNAA